jgi:hypothetical protein
MLSVSSIHSLSSGLIDQSNLPSHHPLTAILEGRESEDESSASDSEEPRLEAPQHHKRAVRTLLPEDNVTPETILYESLPSHVLNSPKSKVASQHQQQEQLESPRSTISVQPYEDRVRVSPESHVHISTISSDEDPLSLPVLKPRDALSESVLPIIFEEHNKLKLSPRHQRRKEQQRRKKRENAKRKHDVNLALRPIHSDEWDSWARRLFR